MVWGVLAPASGFPHGALAGTYGGVGAEATAGAGLGANLLVGGTGRSFSLQPLSVQGQAGLNFAAGVTTLTLTRCIEARVSARGDDLRRNGAAPSALTTSEAGTRRGSEPMTNERESYDELSAAQNKAAQQGVAARVSGGETRPAGDGQRQGTRRGSEPR